MGKATGWEMSGASSATCLLFAGDPGLAQGCWGVRPSSPDVLQGSSCFAVAQHGEHLAVSCDAHIPLDSRVLRGPAHQVLSQGWKSFHRLRPVLRPTSWFALRGCNFGEAARAGHRGALPRAAPCATARLFFSTQGRPRQPQILTAVEDKSRGSENQLWGTRSGSTGAWPGPSTGLGHGPAASPPSDHGQDPSPPVFVVLFLKHQRRTPTSVCWKRGVSPPLSAAAKSPAHFQTRRS